jgi:hypothetical protein
LKWAVLAVGAAGAFALGYLSSALRDYSAVYRDAVLRGRSDQYEAVTRALDSLVKPERDGQGTARGLNSLLVDFLAMERPGPLKYDNGHCILTVKVNVDTMKATVYPGRVDLDDCLEMVPSKQYMLQPDGVWSRLR